MFVKRTGAVIFPVWFPSVFKGLLWMENNAAISFHRKVGQGVMEMFDLYWPMRFDFRLYGNRND